MTAQRRARAEAAIVVGGVSKRYGRLQALDDVSLQVERGEFFGLLGPNGAGKTTLIGIIAGLARADSGHVTAMGHDVVTDYRAARGALGIVPQELVFDPFFTVRETLEFQSGYFGIRNNGRWIDELLENLDLTAKADANMRALSGGMKRRVLVGQALVHKPPVIVLDEPTAGVDVELRQTLWQFIRRLNREGHTIVLTTHYLEEAQELCQRIAMLRAGRIVLLDRTDELMRRFAGSKLVLRLTQADGVPVQAAGQLPDALRARALAATDDRAAARDDDGAAVPVALRVDACEEVEGILAQVRLHGLSIDEMQFVQTDLEDVFVRVMQQERSP